MQIAHSDHDGGQDQAQVSCISWFLVAVLAERKPGPLLKIKTGFEGNLSDRQARLKLGPGYWRLCWYGFKCTNLD
jgi:hypothetical protein